MIQVDARTLADRLTELADALGARPPGETGIKAWFIALRDYSIEDVVSALDTWLRTKAKVPAPVEIRQLLSASVSARLERQAEENGRAPIVLTSGFGPAIKDPNSPAYLAFKSWWHRFKLMPPACSHPDSVGNFVRIGAVLTESVKEARSMLTPEERELYDERRAIQEEGRA